MSCVYCFIFQATLDDIMHVWNRHKIQPSRNCNSVTGRPTILYNIPQHVGADDCSQPVDHADIQQYSDRINIQNDNTYDDTVAQLCTYIMEEFSIELPTNPGDGCELYAFLRNEIRQYIDNLRA